MITDELKRLYRLQTGTEASEVTELPSSGSNRRYFRLAGKTSLIGVCGTSIEENAAFIYMAHHFRQQGLPVPEIYTHSDDKRFYLQEDPATRCFFTPSRKDGRAVSSVRKSGHY